MEADERRLVLAQLKPAELQAINDLLDQRMLNPYLRYEDDPVGFVEEGLGERLWSKQRQILESVRDNKRTAVPACHANGKSHLAARAIAWWISVHPVGTAMAVTTATTFRQVRAILWSHVRRIHTRHNLIGHTTQIEWRIENELVAYGFSPRDTDETAVQGIHAPHLLVVVDEAGGISNVLGHALESIMTGGHTRLLAIGNPPTDTEDSWFERACSSDLWKVIPVSVYDTPNFTGEAAGLCQSCPPEVPRHDIATHLVDQSWVDEVLSEFGETSAFVEARVHARFPKSAPNKVLPLGWVEAAADNEAPLKGDDIRLGVDIAADGGDEFVIARADGYTVRVVHKSSGSANQNAVDVAGVILEHIRQAEADRQERRLHQPIRVKIDTIGVGWGVVSMLQRWRDEQVHEAEVIAVNVAERASEAAKFANQRAEMWWNARTLFQPRQTPSGPQQDVRADLDRRTVAQLSAPLYKSDSSGRIKIESKADMKRRGTSSPDRAEAVLLALYEPPNSGIAPMVAPLIVEQTNPWAF
jgi:hypothetical protein